MAFTAPGALASPAGADAADRALQAAYDAYRAGSAARLAKVAPGAKGHVLASYVAQWQLRLGLEEADPGEIERFLARHDGTLAAEQLRVDYLKLLARRGDWARFRDELARLAGENAEIACYALQGRDASGEPVPMALLEPQWQSERDMPEGCAALAAKAIREGAVDPARVWERFRILGAAGRIGAAKKWIEALPDRDEPGSASVDSAFVSPEQFLAQHRRAGATRATRELVLLALSRLARGDALKAASQLERLKDGLSANDQGYAWGQIALPAARRHMPEALAWFAAAGDAALSDEQRAWHLRAALRAKSWDQVIAATDRMSPAGQSERAAVYWRGRALKALGRGEEAAALFGRIAGEVSFYGRLAAEELGLPLEVPPRAPAPGPGELAEIEKMQGIQRSLALFRLGLRSEAVREWNWTTRWLDDRQLIAAAEFARRHEIWDRAINTADRTVSEHDFSLRYLAPYHDVFTHEARAHAVEEHWVLGLVRQESRFITAARSSAGASGLMQLMPATARWVANKMGLKGFSLSQVNRIDLNAALGTFYLKRVLQELDNKAVLAAAAYNAGPGRARNWLGSAPMEGAVYVETIPFGETRDYVKKVMTNTMYYAAVHGGVPGSLKERLGLVGRAATNVQPGTP